MRKLIIILAILCVATTVSAEWVQVDNFGGIATSVSPSKLSLNQARKSVGWLYRSGELERPTFDKINDIDNLTDGSIEWMAYYSPDDDILFSDGADFKRLDLESFVAQSILGELADTVLLTNGDSAMYVFGDTSSWWLNGSATRNATGSFRTFYTSEGNAYNILVFYNDTLAWLTEAWADTSGSYAITYGAPIDLSASSSWFTTEGDTLWFFDGTHITYYVGDSYADTASTFFPIFYDGYGTIDSLGVDIAGDNGDAVGDSCFLYGDFETTDALKYILWDNYDDPRGSWQYILRHDNSGGADERIKVACDSVLYAYHDTSIGNDIRYLTLDRPIYSWVGVPADSIHRILKHGEHGGISHWEIVINNIANLQIIDGAFAGARAFDGITLKILNLCCDDANIWARLTDVWLADDSIKLWAWGSGDTINHSGFTLARSLNLQLNHGWSMDTWKEQSSFDYSIGALHRRRAYYAGDNTDPTRYTWSKQAFYDTAYAGERLEGSDPITALSSLGGVLAVYRKSGIENHTGFNLDDFYKSPAPAGNGPASSKMVARNPLDNSDYWVNPQGLWAYDGGMAREIPIQCKEIFADSINWAYEHKIAGAIYDRKYWLAAPFGSANKNNRLMTFDLETGAVGFIGTVNVASFLVRRDVGMGAELYIGGADSSIIWLLNGTSDTVQAADYRAGWYDGGDESLTKAVLEYSITYNASSGDSILIDFYTDYSESATWTATIVASATGTASQFGPVDKGVRGKVVSYGLRTPDITPKIIDMAFNIATSGTRKKD